MSHFRSLLAKHPLRVALLVTIVVAMVAISAFAYLLSPRYAGGPRASTVSPPLEFAIELDKDEFQLGENVTIRLSLRNISNNTISVRYGSHFGWFMYFDFHILDENGTTIYALSNNSVFGIQGTLKVLEPGEELTSVRAWEQNYDYPNNVPVAEGSYLVKGLSRLFHLTSGGQTSSMTLETPTVAFTIT